MSSDELLAEIERLSVADRVRILEEALLGLKKERQQDAMRKAAQALEEVYRNSADLTDFTAIDPEAFHEAR